MDERVLAVQKMQDFIEKNLYKKITLLDLSKVSLFSPWYSYRIFKEYIGLTISDYIRKLRLSKSALKLYPLINNTLEAVFIRDGLISKYLHTTHTKNTNVSNNDISSELDKLGKKIIIFLWRWPKI